MWDIETVIIYVCLIVVNEGSAQGRLYAGGHVHCGDLTPSQGLGHALKVRSIHVTVGLVATMFKFQRSLWTCKFVRECQKTGNAIHVLL